MDLSYQKRLAAEVLGVGVDRVWFDPEHLEDIKNAVSREAIRVLVNKGYIQKKQIKGISRARANYLREQKKKGRRVGHGRRKGKKTARLSKKEAWMRQVRAVRSLLREFKKKEIIDVKQYRYLYRQISAGRVRTKNYLKMLIAKMKREEKA
ncbi:MAG: 50S ribosomal protein L19e [Candidatus Nanohaloarchaeota archaeon]|nr:50S ribosomal protein L19e [Candidatus Nanohaloarchaeota archaeon]